MVTDDLGMPVTTRPSSAAPARPRIRRPWWPGTRPGWWALALTAASFGLLLGIRMLIGAGVGGDALPASALPPKLVVGSQLLAGVIAIVAVRRARERSGLVMLAAIVMPLLALAGFVALA